MSGTIEKHTIINQIKAQVRYISKLLSVAVAICIAVVFALFGGLKPIKVLSFDFNFLAGSLVALMAILAIYFICSRSLVTIGSLAKQVNNDDESLLILRSEPVLLNPMSFSNGSFADYLPLEVTNVLPWIVYWIVIYISLPLLLAFTNLKLGIGFLTWIGGGFVLFLIGLFTYGFYAYVLMGFTLADEKVDRKRFTIHLASVIIPWMVGSIFNLIYSIWLWVSAAQAYKSG